MKRAFFILSLAAVATGANAAVAYSTLSGTPDGFGLYVGGNGFSPANEFTSGLSGQLSDIDVVIGNNDGSTNSQSFTMSLLTDNAGVPGSVLGSWNESTSAPWQNNVVQSFATTGVTLAAGQNYWLQFAGTNTDFNSTVRLTGTSSFQANYYDPSTIFATQAGSGDASMFQVNVGAVPEPAPFAALGLGALGLLLRRKKS